MFKRYKIKRMIIILVLVLVIILKIGISIYKFNYKYNSFKNMNIEVKIKEVYKIYEEKIVYEVKYSGDTFLLSVKDVDNVYKYGDILNIMASLYDIKTQGNPYEFNYKRYLNSNGYVSVIYANKIKSVKESKDILSVIYYIRERIDKEIDKNLENKKANLFKSFIYGDDLYLEEDIKKSFSDIGLGHILCVSGAHIAFLIETFETITKLKKSKITRIMLLTFFYILSIFKISLLRAIIMSILTMFKKYNSIYKRYIIALLVVIIINPYYIFNIGVIFSFLSILGITLFNSQINSFLKSKLSLKVFNSLINSVSTTISAQLLIIPFEIATFGKITLICIISNFLLSWIISILMQLGFSLLLLLFIPYVSTTLFNCINMLIDVLLYVVKILNNINYLDIYLPRFNILMYIMYYLLIFIFLIEGKIWIYFWNKRKCVKVIIGILKILSIVFLVLEIIHINYFESYVIYFNVGQGNMSLVHHHTKNIIVDMGSTQENVAYNIMSNFLKAKNIQNIDLVLITHMHDDHMNGIEALIQDENIQIKRIGFSKPYIKVEELDRLLDITKKSKLSKVYLNEEDKIKIGNINIEILSPPKNICIQDKDILNANSNVYLVEKSGKKYLFMGDATKKAEKIILQKYKEKISNIDVLQVSHHGSSTSSCEPFISNFVNCTCIISAKKSVYGHPSQKVIDILDKYNLKFKIIENEGAVVF